MKKPVRIFSLLLAVVLVFSLCGCLKWPNENKETKKESQTEQPGDPVDSSKNSAESNDPEQQPSDPASEDAPYSIVALNDAVAGDVVVFGSYEQDGNTSNGKEPLEWLVLAKEGDSLFVITLYAIERMHFHSSLSKVTWETSSVRAWLNSEFLAAAFSSDENAKIKPSVVIAEANPDYPKSPAGNDTEDKVFLLRIQEVAQYLPEKADRKCSPTEAVAASANVFSISNRAWYAKHGYVCSWWLRSPGMYKDLYVSYVDHGGSTSGGGQVYLENTDLCVRPAMWIRLN